MVLQFRGHLLPYIYNGHRDGACLRRASCMYTWVCERCDGHVAVLGGTPCCAAFDTGVGLVRPMYYHYPELDAAYGMDGNGNNVQYMFGPSILFSPVVTAGDTTQMGMGPGMATKVCVCVCVCAHLAVCASLPPSLSGCLSVWFCGVACVFVRVFRCTLVPVV